MIVKQYVMVSLNSKNCGEYCQVFSGQNVKQEKKKWRGKRELETEREK